MDRTHGRDAAQTRQEQDANLRRLMLIRVAIATALLVPVLYVQLQMGTRFSVAPIYWMIAAVYASTALFGLLRRLTPDWPGNVTAQLVFDVLLATALVYAFGGIRSPFVMLYLLVAFGAGLMTPRQTALAIGCFTGVAYGLMAHLATAGWLPAWEFELGPYGGPVAIPEMYLRIFSVLLSSALVAAIAASFQERLRATRRELHRERQALEALQALNQQLLAGMSSGLLAADAGGSVIACNRAAERVTGLPESAIVGADAIELLGLQDMPLPELDERLAEHEIVRTERTILTPAGEPRVVGMSVTKVLESVDVAAERRAEETGPWSVRGEGPIVGGYIFMFQDLTDIKKMENLFWMRERMAVLGEMASSLAHEIRNPLASISGSLQVLQRRGLPAADQQSGRLMEIVTSESERLSRIIENFLDYARPEKLEAAETDLVALARDTVALLENSPELVAGHVFEILPESDAVPAMVDAARVRQVFWNLARNAVQAMPDGGTLTIRLRRSSGGAEVVFADEGVGMPRETLGSVFRPFVSGSEGGTGLGLAVVYRIVQMHGARVEVESEPGQGTRFILTFRDSRVVRAAERDVVVGGIEAEGKAFDELSRTVRADDVEGL